MTDSVQQSDSVLENPGNTATSDSVLGNPRNTATSDPVPAKNPGNTATSDPVPENLGNTATGAPVPENTGNTATIDPVLENIDPVLENIDPVLENAGNTATGDPVPENPGNTVTCHSVPVKTTDTAVIAMDGSDYSDYALQFYMESIHKPENHVIIVHSTEYRNITYPVTGMVSGKAMMSMLTHEIHEEEQKTNELVDKLTLKMQNLKVGGNIERIHGIPGPSIVTLANEKHADYIVVGCRGKGSVRRTVTGSVTDYIIHHSDVPVIVARHKDHMKHYHSLHIPNPFHKAKKEVNEHASP